MKVWEAEPLFGNRSVRQAGFNQGNVSANHYSQEGWLAKHAVSDEDKLAAEQARSALESRPDDPMQGLEGLDVAGPQPA